MDALLAKIGNPIAISFILALYGLSGLLSKGKELKTLKELFSKDRSEELKRAREDVKDLPEEAAFYDEALREELFHAATRIRCSKKYRRIYQKLVTDGIATVERVRQAWIYIYDNKSRIEIRFSCIEKIMAACLCIVGLYGILAIFVSLNDIASLFDVSKYPNMLFTLSFGIFCVFFPLQQLLPMVIALGIRKRLKEQEDALSSPSPSEEPPLSVQDTEANEKSGS